MLYNKFSRRHFLQGLGGSTLALPFLPSLMSKAEAATLVNPKFLVMFWNGHGGVNLQNMYPIVTNPAVAGNMKMQNLYSAQSHNMLIGNLTSLRTTRASNLPYLATNLDQNVISGVDGLTVGASSYSVDPSGNDFDAGAARVTPIIGSFVSDTLLGKMNLICGLDMMYSSGHTNAQTGNFCNYNGNSPTSASANGFTNVWVPTIDAVAASYPGFYGSSTPIAPSVFLNSSYGNAEDIGGQLSCFNAPGGITGNSNNPQSLGAAFSLLFGSLSGTSGAGVTTGNKRTYILNKIYADYVRVARGAYGPGRRIGQNDRSRFEEFIANVHSILTGVTSYGVCSIPPVSPSDTSQVATGLINQASTQTTLHLYNQMMAAAFSCGVTQSFVFALPCLIDNFIPSGSAGQTFTDGTTGPDTHQAIFHQHDYTDRQTMIVHSQRYYFQYAFYDLMQQLDAIGLPSGTGTMLDQSLLFWTHECGFITHNGNTLPMISAGGAGGFLKTGNFVDYRNTNRPIMYYGLQGHVGIPYNRFLGTALQALGVPPSAYELSPSLFAGTTGRIPVSSLGTVPGYGHPYQIQMGIDANNTQAYPYDYQLNDMSTPLPGIT